MNDISQKNNINIKSIYSKYGIGILFLILIVLISLMNNAFFSFANLRNIFLQVSINGILAVGVTLIIITGGIDLSMGSTVALAGVLCATFAHEGQSILFAFIIGIIVGLCVGVINGLLIAYAKIVPFIVTLGMLSIVRGITNIYTDGAPIIGLSKKFTMIGNSNLFGIPVIVLFFIGVLIIGYIILHLTTLGRYTLATGGNEDAAITSGINTAKIKLFTYGFTGMCCGLAGVLLAARTTAGAPNAGLNYELDAIAAAIIGGTSPSGGKGAMWGTLLGVLIFGVIQNGLDILNVSSYMQQVVKGIIIIGAVWLDKANRSSK